MHVHVRIDIVCKFKIVFFLIQWEPDTDGKLSGRIIRLNFTCSKKSGNAPEMTGCMLIKAQGTVTCKCSLAKKVISIL